MNSEVLKKLRTEAGITQQVLAKAIGAHKSALARWEHGSKIPENYEQAIKEFFGVASEEVLETNNLLDISYGEQESFYLESRRQAAKILAEYGSRQQQRDRAIQSGTYNLTGLCRSAIKEYQAKRNSAA